MISLTPARDAQAEAIAKAKSLIAALPPDDPDKRRWALIIALLEPLQLWVADGRDSRACVVDTLATLCSAVGDALGGVVKMFEKDPEQQRDIAETLLEGVSISLDGYLDAEPAIEVDATRYQHRAGRA